MVAFLIGFIQNETLDGFNNIGSVGFGFLIHTTTLANPILPGIFIVRKYCTTSF